MYGGSSPTVYGRVRWGLGRVIAGVRQVYIKLYGLTVFHGVAYPVHHGGCTTGCTAGVQGLYSSPCIHGTCTAGVRVCTAGKATVYGRCTGLYSRCTAGVYGGVRRCTATVACRFSYTLLYCRVVSGWPCLATCSSPWPCRPGHHCMLCQPRTPPPHPQKKAGGRRPPIRPRRCITVGQ